MTAAQDKRINELETMVQERDQRIASLEDQLASRPIDTGLIQQRELPDRRFVRPTETELLALYRLALALAPKLASAKPVDRHFKAFRVAFSYIATLSRTEKLDQSRATSWWCDGAEQWSRSHGLPIDIPPAVFTLAALCHGDVIHSFTSRWPYDMAFGLAIGGGSPATGNGWQRVLEGSRFLAPIEVPMLPQQTQQHWRPNEDQPVVGLQNRPPSW